MLIGQGRGDTVARLFNDVTKEKSQAEAQEVFTIVREAVTLAVPFAGLPNCMPACFGLVGVLRGRGITDVPGPRRYAMCCLIPVRSCCVDSSRLCPSVGKTFEMSIIPHAGRRLWLRSTAG